jgi:hypothetical protein
MLCMYHRLVGRLLTVWILCHQCDRHGCWSRMRSHRKPACRWQGLPREQASPLSLILSLSRLALTCWKRQGHLDFWGPTAMTLNKWAGWCWRSPPNRTPAALRR